MSNNIRITVEIPKRDIDYARLLVKQQSDNAELIDRLSQSLREAKQRRRELWNERSSLDNHLSNILISGAEIASDEEPDIKSLVNFVNDSLQRTVSG